MWYCFRNLFHVVCTIHVQFPSNFFSIGLCYILIYRIITTQYQTQTDEGKRLKEDTGRTHEDFFSNIFTSHFIARVRKGCWRFACERMMVTERKLHILTPLLWPSRCVFLVLLDAQPEVLGSTPSGLFWGPPRSGVAFPTTSGLYCLEVCWQLHRGFPRSPSVACGLPYHISSLTLWESAGNCFGTPNSTELNNNSKPTRSPIGSLKSNV